MKKSSPYPMHNSPRCTAKSKRSGVCCKNPAVRGWKVCRMHGARGGSPRGPSSPSYKHGRYSIGAKEQRMALKLLQADSLATLRVMADFLEESG